MRKVRDVDVGRVRARDFNPFVRRYTTYTAADLAVAAYYL